MAVHFDDKQLVQTFLKAEKIVSKPVFHGYEWISMQILVCGRYQEFTSSPWNRQDQPPPVSSEKPKKSKIFFENPKKKSNFFFFFASSETLRNTSADKFWALERIFSFLQNYFYVFFSNLHFTSLIREVSKLGFWNVKKSSLKTKNFF